MGIFGCDMANDFFKRWLQVYGTFGYDICHSPSRRKKPK